MKIRYKIWYSQIEKRRQSLNYQKHCLKGQWGTKSTVKSTWSKKITVLSTFLEFSLNFLSNNMKIRYKIWYSQVEKWSQSLNSKKHCLKGQWETKSPVKPTWSKKMTVLSTFLESSLNFLSNNMKIRYKIWYSQVEKRRQSFNYQKHSLREQWWTKSPVKPTWSKKITILNTFLEFLINLLFSNPKNHYKIWYSQEKKTESKYEFQETLFERTVRNKITCKTTWSKKMTVLSTFLESLLNILSDNMKIRYKIWYSQVEKRRQSFNEQKHCLKRQSGTKSPVKPTWSQKMTILNTFLEFSLNFLFNNPKNNYKIWYSQVEKRRQILNCQKHCLKGQWGTKSPVKPTWSKKMAVSSTFLESSLNFLF